MESALQITKLLEELVGLQCARVDNPRGSILTLHFDSPGDLRAGPLAPEREGWRRLTVLSPWRLEGDNVVVCDWNNSGGDKGEIGERLRSLVGGSVLGAAANPPGWDLTMTFSMNQRLFVFGDSTRDREEAWYILGADGAEGSAEPLWRGQS